MPTLPIPPLTSPVGDRALYQGVALVVPGVKGGTDRSAPPSAAARRAGRAAAAGARRVWGAMVRGARVGGACVGRGDRVGASRVGCETGRDGGVKKGRGRKGEQSPNTHFAGRRRERRKKRENSRPLSRWRTKRTMAAMPGESGGLEYLTARPSPGGRGRTGSSGAAGARRRAARPPPPAAFFLFRPPRAPHFHAHLTHTHTHSYDAEYDDGPEEVRGKGRERGRQRE